MASFVSRVRSAGKRHQSMEEEKVPPPAYQIKQTIYQSDSLDHKDEDDEDDDEELLNTAEELGKGFIKTQANKLREFTILLVGETGTGKTTFLTFLANILSGNAPGEYEMCHDKVNEAGGGQRHSQTNFAKIYEFRSRNDIRVRILDTPGLADTRGLAQDNEHKASIAKAIKEHVSTVNAVVVLANGTLPRLGAATDYALATLSSIFPRSLEDNIGLLFTNVSNPLLWNFDQESLPKSLKHKDNQFLLDNPVAMWKKYKDVCSQENKKKTILSALKRAVDDAHHKALTDMVPFFDWLDNLEPQPTKEILVLYEKSQEIERNIANFLSLATQLEEKRRKLTEAAKGSKDGKSAMEQYRDYQNIVTEKVWRQVPTLTWNTMCLIPGCHSNCQAGDAKSSSGLNHLVTLAVSAGTYVFSSLFGIECSHCTHPDHHHTFTRARWQQDDQHNLSIDKAMQEKYTNARSEHERQEAVKASIQKTVAELDKEIEGCLSQVDRLTGEYAKLSLSGSFTGQVGKAIVLLELNLELVKSTDRSTDPWKISVSESVKIRILGHGYGFCRIRIRISA